MAEIMQNIFPFIFEDILLGIFCSIPGLILNNYFVKNGICRDSKTFIVVGCIFGMIATRALAPQGPRWLAMIFIGFASPSGAFRNDLWRTLSRGRWWWKKDEKVNGQDSGNR